MQVDPPDEQVFFTTCEVENILEQHGCRNLLPSET